MAKRVNLPDQFLPLFYVALWMSSNCPALDCLYQAQFCFIIHARLIFSVFKFFLFV